ncbi:MAG: MarR family transcriptional regulator, partial [Elusimicrobia bacterium]|nr:MarR family transcriptional regulator [Elusimicrobiota bacterium]
FGGYFRDVTDEKPSENGSKIPFFTRFSWNLGLKVVSKHKKIEMLKKYVHTYLDAAVDWLKKHDSPQSKAPSIKIPTEEVETLSVTDLCKRWDLVRSQCLDRIKKLEELGYLHSQKDKHGWEIVPVDEVEKFEEEFTGLKEASVIAGRDDENFRKNLRKILSAKKLPGIKVGNLWFLRRKEFNEWLYEKNRRERK